MTKQSKQPTSNHMTPNSAMQKNLKAFRHLEKFRLSILPYMPNYILPIYRNRRTIINTGNQPNNQTNRKSEVKFQISIQIPLWQNIFKSKKSQTSLKMSYTQLSFWQLYNKSPYFRETNYEPQVFIDSNFRPNWLARVGLDHQSNGRGGNYERSWNRVFITLNYSYKQWLFSIEPWIVVFKNDSANLYNPDIAKFLGHEKIVIAYKFKNSVLLSLQIRNLERAKRFFTIQTALLLPITKHINFYVQFFHGYGQSLIEYNHSATSAGVGIALSDWL